MLFLPPFRITARSWKMYSVGLRPGIRYRDHLNITLITVIGGIEALNILASELNLSGPFWDQINILSSGNSFGILGVIIIGLFLASWLISICAYSKAHGNIKSYSIDK